MCRPLFCLGEVSSEECKNKMDQHTECSSNTGRQQKGGSSPLDAACFFFYCQASSGTGPMEQTKDSHTQYCFQRPALGMKDREHFMGRSEFGESAALEICH